MAEFINRNNCLSCPLRPTESARKRWLADKLLGKDFQPIDCSPGPQTAVENLSAGHPAGAWVSSQEKVCGKEREIPFDKRLVRMYNLGTLFSERQGDLSIFYDARFDPGRPENNPEPDSEAYMLQEMNHDW